MRSQSQDHFVNLERRRDWEVSVHTTHTCRSQSRSGSHLSHEKNTKAMQLEIDNLKRKLCHERRRRTPSNSGFSSSDEGDSSYRPKSRTPPSESFSYDEDYHHERKNRSSSSKGLGNDAMSKALNQIFRSPFTRKIEEMRLPRRFTQPTFTMYIGRTNPVEHVSYFNQRMAVHSKNEALMCTVFPSSLGPMAIRWFDGLGVSSIYFFKELTQAFGSRFITCRRVPQPLDSLLSMAMREGETLKTYSDKYQEMFNKIDGDFDDMAIRTFKVGLPAEHGLRKSLTGNLLIVYVNLWTKLTSISGSRRTSNKGNGRLRLSLKRGGISGQTDTTTTDLGETLLGNRGLPPLKWLTRCSENQYTKSWRKSRVSHSSNG